MGKTVLALDFLLNQSTGRNLIYVQLENDVARTNELIKLKATPIDLKMKILSNDLTPTFSEIEIGLSKHIVVHLEKRFCRINSNILQNQSSWGKMRH